ncbi:ANPEP [Mytilus coruscus]|uniref:Aminopeptidase n=1 Tax=Mytilus coruscus TaxID=42192 RepID=A0A6J8BVS3_MYTCO|nr:ANPEP [Mytilus coruscus]
MIWKIVFIVCVLGTSSSLHLYYNKRQNECADVNITTGDTNEYYTLISDYGVTIDNPEDFRIEFQIKASHDVEVLLMSTNNIDDPLYQIILGGPGNTIIIMRTGKKGKIKDSYKDPLLSSNEFKSFIVTWKNSIVKVKDGNEQILIAWKDKRNPLRIVNVGIATSGTVTGEWVIPCKALHQNPCEANELTCAYGNGCYEPGRKCDGDDDCSDASDEENCVLLPLDMYPSLYHLEIQPHIYDGKYKKFYFDGFVKIEMLCRHSTNKIVLHSKELDIAENSILIRPIGSEEEPIYPTLEYNTYYQFIILKSDAQLTAGKTYIVEMSFQGKLTYDLVGLYLSSYKRQSDNTWIYQVATQFQATEARKAFPCFDEPAIKAKFRVTIVRKNHMVSLSNTDVLRQEVRSNNWVADHFAETPMMSTYLLAFVVCDFEHTSDIENGVTFRSWARRDVVNETEYSLKVGSDMMTYFEDYLDVKLPLSKSDMVAVPDFGSEAMENWGLILYKESSILYDPDESSERDKQEVAMLVSHELAHQMNDFVFEIIHSALKWDGVAERRPVYKEVSFPGEIDGMFDDISYEKQAKIDGKLKFVQDIKHILDTWILQQNYPAVRITKEGDDLRLSQSRYVVDLENVDEDSSSAFEYKWVIPVTFTTNRNLRFDQTDKDITWMDRDGSDVVLSGVMSKASSSDWYIGNLMQYGYYRVNYPEENWYNLINQLKTDHTVIPPINRAQIINDAWHLAKSGDLTTEIATQVLDYLPDEDDYVPLKAAMSELNYLKDVLDRTKLSSTFSKFMKKIFSRQFRKFSIDTAESHTEKIAKMYIVDMACDNDDEECIEMAKSSFTRLMENEGSKPMFLFFYAF